MEQPMLQQYLRNGDEGRFAQRLVKDSRMPTRQFAQAPQRSGTSMMHSGNPSLPALTSTASVSSRPSISTNGPGIGNGYLLQENEHSILELAPLTGPVLYTCPFDFLNCHLVYTTLGDLKSHAKTHFKGKSPPSKIMCRLCDRTFNDPNAHRSWSDSMDHLGGHFNRGHRLERTARPAFDLIRHLWQENIIDEWKWKELTGSPDSRSSSQTSSNQTQPGPSSSGAFYCQTNYRDSRRNRNANRRRPDR